MIRAVLSLVAAALLTVADAGYDEVKKDMSWVYTETWDDSSDNYVTTGSSLKYKMLPPRRRTKHSSEITKGETVKVMYKLYIKHDTPDRKHIYSQSTLAEAFSLTAGGGSVIKGFDEAVLLMKDGDRGRFLMPSPIAYGAAGAGGFGIPPDTELEYFLEVHKTGGGGEL